MGEKDIWLQNKVHYPNFTYTENIGPLEFKVKYKVGIMNTTNLTMDKVKLKKLNNSYQASKQSRFDSFVQYKETDLACI